MNGLMKKDYHGSYETSCGNFVMGNRCSYCSSHKTHKYDSFGYHNKHLIKNWHKSNKKSPYEVTCNNRTFKFICEKCKRVFNRSTYNSKRSTRCLCGSCKSSIGEFKILEYLKDHKIKFIHDKPYFKNLVGVGGHVLRPDFILPDYKIWIEYDGEFHYKDMVSYQTKAEFELLKEHDKRKDEYAKTNNWKMIRIPYYDFDNIEEILTDLFRRFKK